MFSVFKDWTLSTLSLPILMHHQPPRAQLAPSPSLTSLQSAELPTISLQSAEQIQINTVRIIVRFLFFSINSLTKLHCSPVYINMATDTSSVTLNMLLTGTTTSRSWQILISQIPCGTTYTAPSNCLQWFTSATEL